MEEGKLPQVLKNKMLSPFELLRSYRRDQEFQKGAILHFQEELSEGEQCEMLYKELPLLTLQFVLQGA